MDFSSLASSASIGGVGATNGMDFSSLASSASIGSSLTVTSSKGEEEEDESERDAMASMAGDPLMEP